MSLFLSKFLPLFVYPVGLVFILVIIALLLNRYPRWQRISLILALVVLWLGGNRWVSMGLARGLEWQYLPPDPIPQADVIVVLGGGTQASQYPRSLIEVDGAGDRVIYGAWLYQQGKAPYILLTGGRIDWLSPDIDAAHEMAGLLEMLGVPEDAIWLESDSNNTYENALYTRQMLEPKGLMRILLVTSAWHMPRSVKLYEAQGFEVIPFPADFRVTQANWEHMLIKDIRTQIMNFIPSADNLALTTRMMKEYIGILFYTLRGWQ
jgi:uncharacterized SAM-binding protein YcdF (DUF218 family)